MPLIVAIVGMPGSGKSEAVKYAEELGFFRIYFGQITLDALKHAGLEINEKNERYIREKIRKEHGMGAYAKLSLPKITQALAENKPVVIDGVYSLEEYLILKKEFGDFFYTIAIYASPKTRFARLSARKERPLTKEEFEERDLAELQNLNKGGPIALADYTILNEGTREELKRNVTSLIEKIKRGIRRTGSRRIAKSK